MSINQLHAMIQSKGIEVLFQPEGIPFTKGAIAQLKMGARLAAATVRVPGLRDKIPPHMREDILTQSYNIMEMSGRCSFVLLLFEGKHIDLDDGQDLMRVFASMYQNMCEREDEVKKLCRLVLETYADPDSRHFSKVVDKDF